MYQIGDGERLLDSVDGDLDAAPGGRVELLELKPGNVDRHEGACPPYASAAVYGHRLALRGNERAREMRHERGGRGP